MLAKDRFPIFCGEPPPNIAHTAESLRAHILKLERAMSAAPEQQVDIRVIHDFAPGLYARSAIIPAGATVVGKIHRTEHMNMLVQGEISVLTENGIERLRAPCMIVSKPGIKRVGYAHSDVVWTTFHPTQETDLEKLEAELISPSFEALGGETPKILLEGA